MTLVSVVIPAHNEEENISTLLEEIIDQEDLRRWGIEVIVVDDNSTDRTGAIAESVAKKNESIRVLHRKGKSSFGEALKLGLREARGEVIVPVMGDRSDDPSDISKLVKAVLAGYDIAIGSRFIAGARVTGYPKWKFVANRLYNILLMILTGKRIHDFTNAFKAYRREVLQEISPSAKGFEITAEIILKAVLRQMRVTEVPVKWRGRRGGEAKFKPIVGANYLATLLRVWVHETIGAILAKKLKISSSR